MSLPRPVRRVQPARRITCNALSALFCLIPAGGGVWHPHPFSPETRQKKAHPYTTINRRVILPAMSLPRPVRRVEPAPRITSDAVSARFCLTRAGGVYMASASILARNKAKKSPPVHDNQSLNTAIASYLPLSRLHSTLRKLTQYHSI